MIKTIKYLFYVGSNNKTKKVESNKAIKVLEHNKIKGYTLKKGFSGFWNNTKEKSFIIEVIKTNDNPINDFKAMQIKEQLKTDLNQIEVLTEKQNTILI